MDKQDKAKHLIGYRFKENNTLGRGRPKGSKNLATNLKHLLKTDLETLHPITGEIQTRPTQEMIAARLVRKALDGDIKAIREIFDRTEGRPRQIQEITGDIKIREFLNQAMAKAVKGSV